MLFLLIIYKIGGIFYLFQSIILIINIICTEYIISYHPDLVIPRWIWLISYLILCIIILILINDLINILWKQWV
jgi:hypothetical protein